MSFLCIACGKDLTYLYKDRRSFSEDSKGAAEPHKQALSSWIEVWRRSLLFIKNLFLLSFHIPLKSAASVLMIWGNISDSKKSYFRESMLLLKKWVSYLNLVRYSSASYLKYVTYLTFFLIAVSLQTTPKRKRRRVGEGSEEHNIARRIISDESSFTL